MNRTAGEIWDEMQGNYYPDPVLTTHEEMDEDTVLPEDACPKCGEDRIDYLVWDDDGTFVTCTTCKAVYVPAVPMTQED
jgi:hypothetical protein